MIYSILLSINFCWAISLSQLAALTKAKKDKAEGERKKQIYRQLYPLTKGCIRRQEGGLSFGASQEGWGFNDIERTS